MAARVTPLHYSLFALEPQHGPSSSLSLLLQVHEAAAVVESGGDAGVERRPPSGSVGRGTLNLLRARNRGYYVPSARNALRAARNRPITCALRARNRLCIGFVTTWHVMVT